MPAPKKPKAKTKAKAKSRPKKSAVNEGLGGHRKTELDILLSEASEEIEEMLAGKYDEGVEEFGLLLTETKFIHAYIAYSFKLTPAMREILPEEQNDMTLRRKGRKLLSKVRVQKALAYHLHLHQTKTGITAEWVSRKYKSWVNADLTQFFEIKKHGNKLDKFKIVPKIEFDDMPVDVRRCIKKMSVDRTGSLIVEFIDQKSALDSLVRLMGFEVQRDLDLNLKGGVNLHFDSQDEDA